MVEDSLCAELMLVNTDPPHSRYPLHAPHHDPTSRFMFPRSAGADILSIVQGEIFNLIHHHSVWNKFHGPQT